MQTGSRLGPRNRIRGQMYKAVQGTVDYARGFRSRPEIFGGSRKTRPEGEPHGPERETLLLSLRGTKPIKSNSVTIESGTIT